jgi:hypothetical protein
MPIFLDRHDVVEFSAEEVAKLHVKDLEVQGNEPPRIFHRLFWLRTTRPS